MAEAATDYQANIIEVDLADMNESIRSACRAYGLKLMIYEQSKDRAAYRQVIDWGADMINLNHGDIFLEVAGNHKSPSVHPQLFMQGNQQVQLLHQ